MTEQILEETGGADLQAQEENSNVDQTGGADGLQGEVTTPENVFTPDFKFRANQEDMEIPEEFRSHIKDLDSQTKIKSMFEKVYGFDAQKEELLKSRQSFSEIEQKYNGMNEYIGSIRDIYQDAINNNNMSRLDTVWQKLGIPEEVVMAYAYEKAQRAEMDPQQRAIIEERDRLNNQMYEMRNQQADMERQREEFQRNELQANFNSAFNLPQVQAFETELDSRFKSGLFREEVIKAGQMAYALEGKILSVPEAISTVINRFGLKGQVAQQHAQPQVNNMSASGKKVIQQDKKTIPNVGSNSGSSPVGSPKAKSLDDIRKRYKELAEQA